MNHHTRIVPAALPAFLPRWISFTMVSAIVFCFLAFRAAAADADTGTIQGRVLNTTTGTYLDKARVRVEGTNLEALTNEFGEYRITRVPAGAAKLNVVYTGQAPQTATVTVAPGTTVNQDIEFAESGALKLGQFTVAADRFKTAQELATNEERFSVNIKNVVAADSYGHIADGNLGEFVKFLPGIQVTYGGTNQSDADATGISIRGFGADQTGIMIDGAPLSNPTAGSLTNQVSLNMLSINNASRIEVIKVPTADMPQDMAGGYVNVISRSAFEYAKPTYGGRVYVALNSENPDVFKKTAGPANEKTYKTIPGADFFVAYPFSKTLGASVSLFTSNQIGENHRDQPTWQRTTQNFDRRPIGGPNGVVTNAAGQAVGLDNPYINRFSITDSPRATYKLDGSIKVDWRPTPSQTLSGTLGYSTYKSINADRRIQYGLGTAQDWGPTFSHSYQFVPASASQNAAQLSPGTSVAMTITDRDTEGRTQNAALNYTFRRGAWMIKAFGSVSFSKSSFPDTQNGHLSGLDINLPSTLAGQMSFDGIDNSEPGRITVKSQAGNVVDTSQLAQWALSTDLRAMSGFSKSSSQTRTYYADLQRELDFIPWRQHLTFKTGVRQDSKEDIKSGIGSGHQWKYVGTGAVSTASMLDENYQTSPGYGLPAQQWFDLYKFYDFFKANPTQFNDNDPAVIVGNYNSYVNQQKQLKQTKTSYYALLDGAFFTTRLHVNAGVRQTENERHGRGPFTDSSWFLIKNADGSYYRDATHPNGVRVDQAASDVFATTAAGTTLRSALTTAHITFPDHVISTANLEGRMLQLVPNHRIDQKVKGKPTWSVNTSFDVTRDIVAKVAWSRSEKQPPLENTTAGLLSGNGAFTLSETTPPSSALGGDGVINVANPALLPEQKTSWNFVLNYYSQSGGKVGVNYFMDKITNRHQGTSVFNNDPVYGSLLASFGLDENSYKNYEIKTTTNGVGTATNNGWELEVSQDFRFLGNWGRSFRANATYTQKKLTEKNVPGTVAFGSSADKFGSAALFFNRGRVSGNIRATYTDVFLGSTTTAAFNGQNYLLYQVKPAVWKYDADIGYQLTRRYSIFASGRDIFNTGTETLRYDAAGVVPAYSFREDLRRFGVIITVGVRGQF